MMVIGIVEITETDFGTKAEARKVIKGIAQRKGSVFHELMNDAVRSVLYDAKNPPYNIVDTGALRSSIRMMDYSAVPKGYGAVSRDVTLNFAIIAGGPPYINPKTHRIVDYAMAVHDGTATMPPRPFLSDAVAKNQVKINKALEDYNGWIGNEWESKGRVKV